MHDGLGWGLSPGSERWGWGAGGRGEGGRGEGGGKHPGRVGTKFMTSGF